MTFPAAGNAALNPSDVVVGSRYAGGKQDRLRVVTDLHGDGYWVWFRANSTSNKPQCVSMPTFLKWAKRKV